MVRTRYIITRNNRTEIFCGASKNHSFEKIKELKNNIKNGNTRYPYIEEHKIEILEELLGGKK